MLMHLYLLKEQDWNHFVALSVVAGSGEQGCSHPLLLNPVPPGTELQHSLSGCVTLPIYWLELAHLGLKPCFSFYKSCSGVRIRACWSQSAFWWFTEDSAEPGLWAAVIPFISPSDRISRQTHVWAHSQHSHLMEREKPCSSVQVGNNCSEFNLIHQLDNLREKVMGTLGTGSRGDGRAVSTHEKETVQFILTAGFGYLEKTNHQQNELSPYRKQIVCVMFLLEPHPSKFCASLTQHWGVSLAVKGLGLQFYISQNHCFLNCQ